MMFLAALLLLALITVSSFSPFRNGAAVPARALRACTECVKDAFDDDVVNAAGPVVVDFYANWCGPCKLMSPIFNAISDDYPLVKFIKVDTDVHDKMQNRYGLQGLPLFGLFVKGKMVKSYSGALPKVALKKFIDAALAEQDITV
ncbi:thioredoxin-like protein [Ochromonadaceae sp. CCMP2298]|nr:thioredoxin-like protein [Ochromonadaceae sp. CCMP2298]|mmetsp:Transcript_21999/g.48899  ORF Transcript_21999/g.48899 Transcript_21999/m.48899 type:complete len:145 (+) Transcript_21999:180-614(+)|eukprot:CAMPEP_0173351512 /NCGR_PEP_ID=MMETSP1144-20121109/15499_1 /TAXON_ID=483371 /ORGANISM="non described non described, Strain CCMP2298" /LENGTH=144 /DNA_ID=CAMNT_0014299615 /DNA_START=217 /DNA_END=651 /DNA_ORIENTATION=+